MGFQMLNLTRFRNIFKMSNRTIMKGNVLGRHVKKEKFVTIPSFVEIASVGHGYAGTPKCMVVNTQHFKYMFNCGEGAQRIASEHKKLKGVNRIFFTSAVWSNVGGLIGTTLTLETAGVPKLFVYGPQDVLHHLSSSRNFSRIEKIDIVGEDMSQGSFTDSAMTIDFINIKSQKNHTSSPKRMKMSDDKDAVAYLCKPLAKPRTLDMKKCMELKIPAGPHLSLLKEEKEVQLPGTDRIIKPDDVLFEKEPNDPFLVLECPSIDHLDSLVSSPEILRMQEEDTKVCLVVHFTHSSIMKHPMYVQWMEKFGPSTRHMVLNDLCSTLDTEAPHRVQAIRNLVHPEMFPLLPHSVHPEDHFIDKKEQMVMKDGDSDRIHYAKTNTRYVYRPLTAEPFTEDQCVVLDNKKFTEAVLLRPGNEEFITNFQKNLGGLNRTALTPDDPEIVFLGTGSAVPNKYRNVSCILINVGEDASMLLDCGENSCGQLYRHYGARTPEKLKKLKAVFVSHLHADHHLGLIGLAIERQKCLEEAGESKAEPLIVVGPELLYRWYSSISCSNIPIERSIRFLTAESLKCGDPSSVYAHSRLLNDFGFKRVRTVRVQHAQCPHGIRLEHKTGWSIVYSGDTMPCGDLIRLGEGCDLLIHEATFDHHKADEAKEKRHSTSDQAIDVGRKMKAKFTLLTHFSQRYDKVPLFSENFSEDVGVAFDNMTVRLSELHHLPKFVPALKVVHEEEYQMMLESIENTQFRMESAKEMI